MPGGDAARYLVAMVRHATSRAIRMALSLVCALTMIAPAHAERQTRARLVSCGENSCLRLSGYRALATMVVRVGEHDLSVEGDRAWQATVPLDIARAWPIARNYALRVAFVDPDAGTKRVETVMLPPGSLGARTQIASLIVSAR
ncbi:hypothetical protein [Sphingomonas faeni]|uniref:hypothetical protein n=2 Tax=Sphingomonas faeni TaxID=185950 RepID=UPI0033650D1B